MGLRAAMTAASGLRAAMTAAMGLRAAMTAAFIAALLGALAAGCGAGGSASAGSGGNSASSGPISIVAAENFWGSIASQLAGNKATVKSIIADPATDPHSYQPKASDARTFATAKLVVVNGVGYDPWAPKLLNANPVPGRIALTVGDLFHLKEGDNPHRWYDPASVDAVANAITADLKKLDPNDAAYYDRQRTVFQTQRLARYHRLIADIRTRYAGVPVGASESIIAMLAPSLGLKLTTPPSFMKATTEGTEVSAQDTSTTQQQIASRRIKVWIYNSQNATPQIKRLNALALQQGIPIATVTETLTPPGASFEDWQASQLQRLEQALRQATGK